MVLIVSAYTHVQVACIHATVCPAAIQFKLCTYVPTCMKTRRHLVKLRVIRATHLFRLFQDFQCNKFALHNKYVGTCVQIFCTRQPGRKLIGWSGRSNKTAQMWNAVIGKAATDCVGHAFTHGHVRKDGCRYLCRISVAHSQSTLFGAKYMYACAYIQIRSQLCT
jgi:hypothetical protein